MSKLVPLGNTFLFQFLSETKNGLFTQKNKGLIYIPNAAPEIDNQGILCRYGKITAIGEDVKEFGIGDVVLIGAGRWTVGFVINKKTYWKSDEDNVLAVHTCPDSDTSLGYDY
jgi:co-chaperonin GroES (HSP10)